MGVMSAMMHWSQEEEGGQTFHGPCHAATSQASLAHHPQPRLFLCLQRNTQQQLAEK